jgi:hypothetical protein
MVKRFLLAFVFLSLFAVGVHALSPITYRATLFACIASLAPLLSCENYWPFIFGLLCASRPAAIPRLVIAVHINAIDLMTRWTNTHIGKKVRETAAPALAHCYTSAAVMLPATRFRIFAAENH